MILGKKLYENHGVVKGFIFSLPSLLNFLWSKVSIRSRQKKSDSSGNGVPYLVLDEKGKVLCNACKLCIDICPTSCMSLKGPDVSQWTPQSKPKSFTLDLTRCTMCKLCEDICPIDAIQMSHQTVIAGAADWNWKMDLEMLSKRPGVNQFPEVIEAPNP